MEKLMFYHRRKLTATHTIPSTETTYGVLGIRSEFSVCGAARRWVKSNGQVIKFSTLEEAKNLAEQLNNSCSSPNVYYIGKEI